MEFLRFFLVFQLKRESATWFWASRPHDTMYRKCYVRNALIEFCSNGLIPGALNQALIISCARFGCDAVKA